MSKQKIVLEYPSSFPGWKVAILRSAFKMVVRVIYWKPIASILTKGR